MVWKSYVCVCALCSVAYNNLNFPLPGHIWWNILYMCTMFQFSKVISFTFDLFPQCSLFIHFSQFHFKTYHLKSDFSFVGSVDVATIAIFHPVTVHPFPSVSLSFSLSPLSLSVLVFVYYFSAISFVAAVVLYSSSMVCRFRTVLFQRIQYFFFLSELSFCWIDLQQCWCTIYYSMVVMCWCGWKNKLRIRTPYSWDWK